MHIFGFPLVEYSNITFRGYCMAFEPNFEKVVASVRERLGTIQSQVECKLPTNDDVNKILCNNAKVNVVSVETNGKDIVYSGFVNFQVLYVSKNAEPISMDYTAEFKDSFRTDRELSNVVPIVSAEVVDVNVVVNGDIRAVATVEFVLDGIINNSSNVLTGVTGDNYFARKETLNYSNYVATATNKFEVVNDVEIKDGISKVLSVCPYVYIQKVVVDDRFLTINGGITYNICYLTDNNIIRTLESNFDFSQEIAQDDINVESQIQSNLQVLYNDIKVTTNIDTDSAIVNIMMPLYYQGYVFQNSSVEVVSDVYSTEHFTNITAESLSSLESFETIRFDEKLNGSITIQENDAFIDEVLGSCCSNVVVANSTVDEGLLTVEGVATVNVLYLNKETNSVYSLVVEMPFSESNPVDIKNGNNTAVQLALTNVTTRARRGKEIEVTATLEIYTDVYNNMENVVITQITEEDEIPENECAMLFYMTKDGDSLWEIAKELRISTDLLLSQNPNLTEPIQAGTRVVVYRQRQVEF